ncbi:hypothetical protein [Bifidobacterium phasiani]|uniref:Uncharacterized protein n=1 Tax=Bifidobacterium phasiani TaxID=2834431 RepID=A0ABS6WAZ9_9BIFI|nr:hypothetical protein [Bifidobacterium phasiani]MBW3083670.1 hypothetical protein [Bifidobacterium phasiani]
MKIRPRTGSAVIGVIGMLLFVVYALAIFMFSGVYTSVGICSIVFAVIAFLLLFLTPQFMFKKRPDIEAVFFGIPLASFAAYYFLAEIFVSMVFLGFQSVIPFNIALFLQVVLLVAFVIIALVSVTAQQASAQQSEDRRSQAVAWSLQSVDIRSIIDSNRMHGADAALLEALDHLSETITYSDAFSHDNPAIKEVEGRITARMRDLQSAAANNDFLTERRLVQELENLYAERSRKLLLVK